VRVLVIGSGGREHAIVRGLVADPAVSEVHCAPGNPGIASLAQLHAVNATDRVDVARLAKQVAADLVVIGPEAPLVAGVADQLRASGFAVFGPDEAAARIEGSKAFSKEIMAAAGVPTAQARVCTTPAQAEAALREFGAPYVVKDDALAAGKGVVVTEDLAAALAHAASCERVVIEEYLDGPEVSLFAVADGTMALPLLAAQDFKRAGDGDLGPNTGGMGAYLPLAWVPDGLTEEVMGTVVRPTIAELARRGAAYKGLLYVGLALTSKGPKVVEFNARFGDPETQVVLNLLATPLAGLLRASAVEDLGSLPPLEWRDGAAVTVVIAAEGYPEGPAKGDVITLNPVGALPAGCDGYVLHAGTARSGADLVTAGGRVLNAVGTGPDLASARAVAYAVANSVEFRGAWYRTDIAERAAAEN
jgi:phosphoribosylamine---glycine ligase